MERKKILLAGSHAGSTASALVKEIKKRNLDWKLIWIGRKYANESDKTLSLEYLYLTKMGLDFIDLDPGKIQVKLTRYTIPALMKIPIAAIRALKLVSTIKPDLVFSFGGAAGALISFVSWLHKIPVIIHEQTSSAGRANIFSSSFARVVILARKSSKEYFKNKKVVVAGNPLNPDIVDMISKNNKNTKSIKKIFVTGGSRGSLAINDLMFEVLDSLLKKYKVVHQTGESDFSRFSSINNKNYFAFSQTSPEKMAKYLFEADLIISRAGANTTSEIVALNKPSILIPLLYTYKDEQKKNAEYVANLGLGIVLDQQNVNPKILMDTIYYIDNNYQKYCKIDSSFQNPDLDASKNIVNIITKLLGA